MSKEVNNKKINISNELLKKQIFDCSILFIAFCVIFYFVRCLNFDSYDLIIVLVVAFLAIAFALEYSKNAVKNPLNKIVSECTKKQLAKLIQFKLQTVINLKTMQFLKAKSEAFKAILTICKNTQPIWIV